MATYEHNALTQYKEENGDMHIVYPITKVENVVGIDELNASITKMNNITEVTIPASGWSSSAPYTQEISVSGITANDCPEVYLKYGSSVTADNAEAYTGAFGNIHKFETLAGKLKVTAFLEKPSVDVTVMLKGV